MYPVFIKPACPILIAGFSSKLASMDHFAFYFISSCIFANFFFIFHFSCLVNFLRFCLSKQSVIDDAYSHAVGIKFVVLGGGGVLGPFPKVWCELVTWWYAPALYYDFLHILKKLV